MTPTTEAVMTKYEKELQRARLASHFIHEVGAMGH